MKILLLGDYSNYHACLGDALRRLGHTVVVASDGGGFMKTEATIALRRRLPGPAGGALLYAQMLADRRLRGFDVVSLIAPSFVTLRPGRLRKLYKHLRRYNGGIFLGSVGTDKAIMDFLLAPDCPLRYSEYMNGGELYKPNAAVLRENALWQQGDIAHWCEELYDSVDGVTTALYEYHLAMQRRLDDDRLAYTGIPVDLGCIKPLDRPLAADGCVNLFLGVKSARNVFKGTDRIGAVARRLAREFPDRCRLTRVTDMPYRDYLAAMRSADIVLDQLYSYSPATNALQAMAAGQAVLSGGENEFYDFITEPWLRPVINCSPSEDEIYATLKEYVLNPEKVVEAGKQGRQFVKKHNDSLTVAARHLKFWNEKL